MRDVSGWVAVVTGSASGIGRGMARSFTGASHAVLATPAPTDRVPENDRLDAAKLASDISANGVPATAAADVDEIVAKVKAEAKPGDLLLVMSNGSFGGIIEKLLRALSEKA